MSGTLRTVKTWSESMPGICGRIGAAPGERVRVSYFSVLSSPVATSLTVMVLAAVSTAVTSWPVRAMMRYWAQNCGGDMSTRLSASGIAPERCQGRQQLEKETCGPRSNMMISTLSSRRRSRAAVEAPPATPPTMR